MDRGCRKTAILLERHARAVVEQDLLARRYTPARPQYGDARVEAPCLRASVQRHEGEVGILVGRVVVDHGRAALPPLRRALRQGQEAAIRTVGCVRDTRRELPAIHQKVRVGDAHEIAPRLRLAIRLSPLGLPLRDELALRTGHNFRDHHFYHFFFYTTTRQDG